MYKAFGIITPYMAEKEEFEKCEHISIPALSLGRAITSIGWDDSALLTLSNQTRLRCIFNFFSRIGWAALAIGDESSSDVITRIKAELSDPELVENHLQTMLQLHHNSNDPFDPIVNLYHGVFTQDNWKRLEKRDFWLIARCYGVSVDDSINDMVQVILEDQTRMAIELVNNGFGPLDHLMYDAERSSYEHGVLLPVVPAIPRGWLRDALEEAQRNKFRL